MFSARQRCAMASSRPLRQQAGGVVRGAEKQAVQRRSQGIEDRVGQLPAIALPQAYSTTSQSTVCSARRYSAKPGMTIIARRGLRPWTRVNRFSFAVAGEDMRRRQLMVGSQRLMQLLILDVRVAFGAAGLSTIACLSEAGIPSGLMLALKSSSSPGLCPAGRRPRGYCRHGRFSVRPCPFPVWLSAAGQRRAVGEVGFNPGEDRLGHLLLEFGRFQFPLFFHVTDKRRLHQNGGISGAFSTAKPACSTRFLCKLLILPIFSSTAFPNEAVGDGEGLHHIEHGVVDIAVAALADPDQIRAFCVWARYFAAVLVAPWWRGQTPKSRWAGGW